MSGNWRRMMASDTGKAAGRPVAQSVAQSAPGRLGPAAVPVAERLGLDQDALAASVCRRYVPRLVSRQTLERRNEEAFESFGKPGRDPGRLGSVAAALAKRNGWGPHLRVSRLARDWPRVVGPAIAANTSVGEFRDGVLVIRAKSPVWANQLRYMVPQITRKVAAWLAPTPVTRVEIRSGRPERPYRRSSVRPADARQAGRADSTGQTGKTGKGPEDGRNPWESGQRIGW